jgi:cytochrome oxidase Cu insertion factor (SCO1/SenC/PrrC family)
MRAKSMSLPPVQSAMGAIDRRKRVAHDRRRGYAERGYCPRCLPFQFFDHTGSVGGPLTLTDQTGKQRSDTEFRGKLMIVYFGYTYCPDVCPTDLMAITQALNALGPAAEGIQPVFITINPERDTKVLADYVSAFHHSLIGLTGSPEEIRTVANSYKVFYAKVPDEPSGDYSINHTGVIYLMGRNGEYLGFMPPQTNPDRLTEVLRKYLAK